MSTKLKVLTLNCWGIPWVSRNRRTRIRAISEYLVADSDCDVACLQEVWTEGDYELIRRAVASRLPHAHYFHSGVVGSGVCMLSRHELLDAFFHQWPINGYMHKLQHGDWWGGKGVGMCRMLIDGLTVHVYSMHLHAEYDRVHDEYIAHRVLQAYDTAQFVRLTGRAADVVVLAGDLNTEPEDLACRLLLGVAGLRDSCPDRVEQTHWTHEAPGNSYTPDGARPKRIDYVMYGGACVLKCAYAQPLAMHAPGTTHSYSDHEAVLATLMLGGGDRRNRGGEIPLDADTLADGLRVLDETVCSLAVHRRMYACACLVLFAALWAGAGSWDAAPGPLAWLPLPHHATLHLLRIAVTGLMLFTLIMATLWNRIECNAVKATSHSIRLQLKQLAQPS